jgi:hypothetical protein
VTTIEHESYEPNAALSRIHEVREVLRWTELARMRFCMNRAPSAQAAALEP